MNMKKILSGLILGISSIALTTSVMANKTPDTNHQKEKTSSSKPHKDKSSKEMKNQQKSKSSNKANDKDRPMPAALRTVCP